MRMEAAGEHRREEEWDLSPQPRNRGSLSDAPVGGGVAGAVAVPLRNIFTAESCSCPIVTAGYCACLPGAVGRTFSGKAPCLGASPPALASSASLVSQRSHLPAWPRTAAWEGLRRTDWGHSA